MRQQRTPVKITLDAYAASHRVPADTGPADASGVADAGFREVHPEWANINASTKIPSHGARKSSDSLHYTEVDYYTVLTTGRFAADKKLSEAPGNRRMQGGGLVLHGAVGVALTCNSFLLP
jgi:hypothetical protein